MRRTLCRLRRYAATSSHFALPASQATKFSLLFVRLQRRALPERASLLTIAGDCHEQARRGARADRSRSRPSLERLFALLRIQSVSTDPAYKDALPRPPISSPPILSSIGFDGEVRPTPGHPIVVGKSERQSRPAKARASCSTAITTCSRSIRSTTGPRRRSSRGSRRCPTAARSSSRAAPATTKARP